jgi:two-component system cell cycle response regulator DivK
MRRAISFSPERAAQGSTVGVALSGLEVPNGSQTQGVALGCHRTAFQASEPVVRVPTFVFLLPHSRLIFFNPMAKILLVEDNEMNRDMLSRRLERKGYVVAIALDGQQAVDMAASEAPALILMDMSLPVLDGWEATRRIKSNEATKRIPVIALTAHAMQGDEQKAREAGCDDFDTKPVELPRLLEKIQAQLNRVGAS